MQHSLATINNMLPTKTFTDPSPSIFCSSGVFSLLFTSLPPTPDAPSPKRIPIKYHSYGVSLKKVTNIISMLLH